MLDPSRGGINRTTLTFGGQRRVPEMIEKSTKERPNVTAARDSGKKIDGAQPASSRQGLKDAEVESRTANTTAGEAKPSYVLGPLIVFHRRWRGGAPRFSPACRPG